MNIPQSIPYYWVPCNSPYALWRDRKRHENISFICNSSDVSSSLFMSNKLKGKSSYFSKFSKQAFKEKATETWSRRFKKITLGKSKLKNGKKIEFLDKIKPNA